MLADTIGPSLVLEGCDPPAAAGSGEGEEVGVGHGRSRPAVARARCGEDSELPVHSRPGVGGGAGSGDGSVVADAGGELPGGPGQGTPVGVVRTEVQGGVGAVVGGEPGDGDDVDVGAGQGRGRWEPTDRDTDPAGRDRRRGERSDRGAGPGAVGVMGVAGTVTGTVTAGAGRAVGAQPLAAATTTAPIRTAAVGVAGWRVIRTCGRTRWCWSSREWRPVGS